jgi:hypothetical protein
MKKLLLILGVIFVVLIVCFAGFFGFAAYQGRNLDASSKAYVEANIPPILSTWSKSELVSRAAPGLLKTIEDKPEQIDRLFKSLSKLGALKSFGDVKGDSAVFYSAQNGKVTTANYAASAKFERGDAQINVRLTLVSGEWRLLLLNVNSPALLE